MEEQIDVLDEVGNKTGEIKSKSAVHRDSDVHRTVHVWFLNSKNELLLQKRSPQKDRGAGMWDVSVGGHISAGQTPLEAAVREVEEEIGVPITPSELAYLFTTPPAPKSENRNKARHYQDVYLIKKDLDIPSLKLQDGEVDEVRYISVTDFKKWISEEKQDLLMHPEEYQRLLELLENKDI